MKELSQELKFAINELKKLNPELAEEYESSLIKRTIAARSQLILEALDKLPTEFPPELRNDLFEPVRKDMSRNYDEVLAILKIHGSSQSVQSQAELIEKSSEIGGNYKAALNSKKVSRVSGVLSSVRQAGRIGIADERMQNNLFKSILEKDLIEESKEVDKNIKKLERKSKKRSMTFQEREESIHEEEMPLKKNKSDVDNISDAKKAAIRIAIKKDDYRAIRHLLNNGVDSNYKDENGDTILHRSIKSSKPRITEYLIRLESVDLDSINNSNETPLILLVKNYSIPNVLDHMDKILHLGEGANIADEAGNNALHHLALIWEEEGGIYGENTIDLFPIKVLLVQHVDSNAKNKDNKTPFEISIELEKTVSVMGPPLRSSFKDKINERKYVDLVDKSQSSGGYGKGF